MPKKRRLPQYGIFFTSQMDYQHMAGTHPENIPIYVRTTKGWYINGKPVLEESSIPTDLWPMRPVQRG